MQLEFRFDGHSSIIEIEEWKPVVGFPRYDVSSLGRFRHRATGKYLSGTIAYNGYVHIGLMKDGKQVTKLAHRLVAETFHEQPTTKHSDVNHKNKVRDDNRASNLEWCTRSENSKHAKKNS